MADRNKTTRIILFVIFSILRGHYLSETTKAIIVKDLENLYFGQSRIADLRNTRSKVECASQCRQYPQCKSFAFNEPDRICVLHSVIYFNTEEGIPSASWAFYTFGEIGCPTHLGFISIASDLCIFIDPFVLYNFAGAQHLCSSIGSRVMSLHTEDRRKYFKVVMAQLELVPDLYALLSSRQIYLGLQKDPLPLVWRWDNGETITREQIEWGDLQPLCPTIICNCMTTLEHWGWRWNDVSCFEAHRVICEYTGPLN